MKVKDLERTANIAWSPTKAVDIYLAAGTAGQQLDASFDTHAALEVFALNLGEPGAEMESKATLPSQHRFHKLAWSAHGSDAGTIVGGCDAGVMQIYSAAMLLQGEHAVLSKQEKHTGAVHAIDFNPFQGYLLASGAAASEIYIWDLNSLSVPMTPGSRSQPFEDVLSIQWNRQVQHILASTFASKCVVWDLRKNETIIKLTDTVARIRWKSVAWHPEVATQLCLASEEDHAPIIQLWDLRFATSPLKTLENHRRGVLSIAWSADDPDLLVSTGKDSRILCWNPNSNQAGGEVLSEVARTNQWNFDIAWCPKNPALVATPGFDGHVSVYSLLGGKAQQIQTTNKIADSFPGMDAGDYVQAPVQQAPTPIASVDLTKAPKWLKKPVGAKFGFGGKLVTFDHDKAAIAQQQQGNALERHVHISQVVTEPELVRKSAELEQALEFGNFTEYCRNKADSSLDQHTRYVWHFLKANFEQNPRSELLNLLGYKIEDVNAKLSEHVQMKSTNKSDARNLAHQFDSNCIDSDYLETAHTNVVKMKPIETFQIKTGDDSDGLIAQAILLNNVEAAVDLCMQGNRYADAIIIARTGSAELYARTERKYLDSCEGYVSNLIGALVSGDWASVVAHCDLASWREALAAALTHSSEEDLPLLCEIMGARLEAESQGQANVAQLHDAQLCYICAGSFNKLVASWSEAASSSSSTERLQELVELVTLLQKAVERQGKQVEVTGELADLLARYALLLAAQGSLHTALTYLGASKDERIATLRDRLYVALGHKPSYGQTQNRSRHNTGRSSISAPSYPPAKAATTTPMWQPAATPQMWQTQPLPQPAPTAAWHPAISSPNAPPPIAQPPRAGSVGLATVLPKCKYVLDPSVQRSYDPKPTNAAFMNPAPINGASPLFAAKPIPPAQFAPTGMDHPHPTAFQHDLNVNPSASAMNALPAQSAAGWNDPPVLSKTRCTLPKQHDAAPNPITHPIFGSAPVQQTPANGCVDPSMLPPPPQQAFPSYANPAQMGHVPPIHAPDGPMFTTQQQMLSPPQAPFANFNTQPIVAQQPMAEPVVEAALQAQPAPKLPIPEEHLHMQTVLDELRVQCARTAMNPQTKRKIEDVGKKLETLYDLLREHKLSSNALAGLHQIVQQIQHGDYQGGLFMHTQLVSGPDFAQIAAFMPGIKVLLQCALQLQVYLR